jgi:hypothetical protein
MFGITTPAGLGAKDAAEPMEDSSVVGEPGPKQTYTCAICATKSSRTWYHCPDDIGEAPRPRCPKVMCKECGLRWRLCESRLVFFRSTSLTLSFADGNQVPPVTSEVKAKPGMTTVRAMLRMDWC